MNYLENVLETKKEFISNELDIIANLFSNVMVDRVSNNLVDCDDDTLYFYINISPEYGQNLNEIETLLANKCHDLLLDKKINVMLHLPEISTIIQKQLDYKFVGFNIVGLFKTEQHLSIANQYSNFLTLAVTPIKYIT